MCSKNELERELNKLPPSPYKPTADLREVHRLFHMTSVIDEGVPHSVKIETREDARGFAESVKPTNLSQALQLTDNLCREVFENGVPEGSGLVLKLGLKIYTDHYPPERVDHSY